MIIEHNQQPIQRGYYSKILNRSIVTAAHEFGSCTIYDQIIPRTGFIVLHSHEYDEVLTFIEGSVVVTLNGVASEVHAPCSIVIHAGELHEVVNPHQHDARLIAYHATATPKNHYPNGTPTPVVWDTV